MSKQLFSATYAEPKTFFPFGDNAIVGFFGEEIIENYQQPNAPDGAEPITGYRYTGTRQDGGTLLKCEDPSDYGCLTNAIIRNTYSESEELAIHRHYVNSFEEHQDEWNEYNQVCENAKLFAKKWLGIE
jgi:hypothetical protein